MTRRTLLIVTALRMEAQALQRALRAHASRFANDIEFMPIGITGVALPEHVPARVDRVLLAGLAGGLAPQLQVGDVVLDGRDDDPISPLAGVRSGQIHTVATPVCTPAEKASLFDSTGALSVDMEGSVVRAWAMKTNVRFLHLRAISDTADHAIDPAVIKLVDPMGNPKPAKVAFYLFQKPARIRTLRTLQANSKIALAQLSDAMIHLLDHLNASY